MTAIKTVPVTIPVLALRGLTVFPQLTLHFDVGRAASIQALEEAMGENKKSSLWKIPPRATCMPSALWLM